MSTRPDNILEFDGIAKGFAGVSVLKGVTLPLPRGSVLGLVGENGAGKSTLMNVLGGLLQPDAGRMTLDGRPYAPRSSRAASEAGVAFIHQELNLFTNLSVAENLHLGRLPRRRAGPLTLPLVDYPTMRRRARELLAAVDLHRTPDELVESLSPGQRQLVEIARALGGDARLIILDEPTTSLTATESERLFSLIARLRGRGVSMIYISHHLREVLRLCDRVAVLRDGQLVGSGPRQAFDEPRLISMMVGRSIEQLYPARARCVGAEPVLVLQGVTRSGVVEGVSLALRRGEVLGLSGLMGAGRTELARLIFGLDPIDRGRVLLEGRPFEPSPRRSIRAGIAFLTENRREEGLMMPASVSDNASLVTLREFAATPLRLLRRGRIAAAVGSAVSSVRLAGAAALRQAAGTLSGGNQQKLVLAKWLLARPRVFILDEPTRGVDVAARHEIYKTVNALAEGGAAVLLISSEIEELIGMCDRILVMAAGHVRDELPRGQFQRERILRSALQAPPRSEVTP